VRAKYDDVQDRWEANHTHIQDSVTEFSMQQPVFHDDRNHLTYVSVMLHVRTVINKHTV